MSETIPGQAYRQEKEQKLRRSEALYRSLFEISNEGIYRWELDEPLPHGLTGEQQAEFFYQHAYIAQANDALAAMYGLASGEAMVRKRLTSSYLESTGQIQTLLDAYVQNSYRFRNLETEELINGYTYYFLNSVMSFIENDRVIGGWGTQIDITELRKAQQAILEERNRIAGEIHDVLAQAFTGISVQLELAKYLIRKNPAEVGPILDRISDLAQTGLTEARRSVWSVYLASEADTDLAQNLANCLQKLTHGTSLETGILLYGESYPLSSFISKNLLRIGQEAVINSLKHAQAKRLWVELTYVPHQIILRVGDDGCGFCPQQQTEGFGLIGISERVDRIHGHLRITTHPNQGTEIFVQVPT
jgi:signal transduction histidine kinase